MSRIFILSTNVSTDPYPVYPLGTAVVASALVSGGHLVRQFDFLAENRSEERLKRAIRSFVPDFVGVSIRNIDSVDSFTADSGWYLAKDKKLIGLVRQVTDAPIILGGPALSLMPEEILDYTGADYGVVGEGEQVVLDLVLALEEGRPVPRITGGKAPLLTGDEISPPRWNRSLIEFYLEGSGIVNLQTKRGCPHQCAYCGYPRLEGRRYRFRDPKAVVDDLDRLKRTYGVDTIFFADSVFNDLEGHHLKIAEEILSRDLEIRWSGFFRPQGIRRKDLAMLKRSGLFAIEAGTDASSDRTLENLKKGFCFEEVVEFSRMCVEERIPCAHYIMFGGPGETEETVGEGLENIKMLEHCVVFAFSGIRIFPGTGLHERALKEKILAEDEPLLRPVYYFSPHIVPGAMNERIETAFKGSRGWIFPPSEGRIRIAAMNRLGYRGLLWDMLIPFSSEKRQAVR